MFEFIVEFDYICVKYITELQQFKHFKYWFGVCIIPAAERERRERRNVYLKSNKMVNTTLANSLLRRLHTQYVQHNIQYLQKNI